jgi:hypothetical protein
VAGTYLLQVHNSGIAAKLRPGDGQSAAGTRISERQRLDLFGDLVAVHPSHRTSPSARPVLRWVSLHQAAQEPAAVLRLAVSMLGQRRLDEALARAETGAPDLQAVARRLREALGS